MSPDHKATPWSQKFSKSVYKCQKQPKKLHSLLWQGTQHLLHLQSTTLFSLNDHMVGSQGSRRCVQITNWFSNHKGDPVLPSIASSKGHLELKYGQVWAQLGNMQTTYETHQALLEWPKMAILKAILDRFLAVGRVSPGQLLACMGTINEKVAPPSRALHRVFHS